MHDSSVMPKQELQHRFRANPQVQLFCILIISGFMVFGIHELHSPMCPHSYSLSFTFVLLPFVLAAIILFVLVVYSDSKVLLHATPTTLTITSRWMKLIEKREFRPIHIRSISIIPFVSEDDGPSDCRFYLVIKLWSDEPLIVGNAIKKSEAFQLASDLSEIYAIPFEDHTGENVDTSDYCTVDLFSSRVTKMLWGS